MRHKRQEDVVCIVEPWSYQLLGIGMRHSEIRLSDAITLQAVLPRALVLSVNRVKVLRCGVFVTLKRIVVPAADLIVIRLAFDTLQLDRLEQDRRANEREK